MDPEGQRIWEAIRAHGPIGISDLHYALLLDDRTIRDHIRRHRELYQRITDRRDGFPIRTYQIKVIL